jgi:3-oxoacyl-[acyl-carrier-protein] synthase II
MTGDGDGPRVLITGVGVVHALGTGGIGVVAALARSRLAAGRLRAFSTEGLSSHLAVELPPSALGALIDPDQARRLSRISQMTVAACRLALSDAGLTGGGEISLVVGTEFGDLRSTEAFALGYLQRGVVGLSAVTFPNTVMNTMAASTAIALGLRGASITLTAWQLAGELAVARAAALVRAGRTDVVLAGGVDELQPLRFAMLSRLGVLSPRDGREEGSRPFDERANGAVYGEGATFVVLESGQAAAARGAHVLGEIRGAAWRFGKRADAIGPALAAARMSAPEVGWIYAAGSGHPGDERRELASVRRIFGCRVPPVTSLTPVAGQHAGLGPLRVAAAAWTAGGGVLPGIATLETPRAEARGIVVGPGMHDVRSGPGLVHGVSASGDHVAIVVASAA